MKPRRGFLAWAAVVVVLGAYGWIVTQGQGRFDSHPGNGPDLYARLVSGFAAGHLYIQEAPAPELLKAANPYDQAVSGGLRLPDASLYHGHYYVYFGVTPVVVWLWPYYGLSGSHPPTGLTTLLFCSAAFLTGCVLLDRIRRLHFPGLAGPALAVAVLAWGLGNSYAMLLGHHDTYEIAAASGVWCLVTMLCLLHAALVSPAGRGAPALAAASAFYALGVGSRPTLIFAGAVFALVLGFRWWRTRRIEGRLWWAAILPAAVILLGLFAYNQARFGHPLEFGLRYQLSGPDRSKFTAFAWRYVPFNAYYYLLSPPHLSIYFPFILWPAGYIGTPPAGHEGAFGVIGLIWTCPFVFLAVGTLGWSRPAGPSAGEGRIFTLALLGVVLAVGGVLLGIGLCVYRCLPELLSPLLLLAVVGWMVLGTSPKALWLRRGLMLAGGAALAWTALANVLLSTQVEGMYLGHNPEQYARLEKTANEAVGGIAERLGWHPSRPVISLRFPADGAGTEAPLVVAGMPPLADFLYVYYVTPHDLQIGFESMGRGGPVSGLIPIDYGAPHTLEIEGGWLLPPPGIPWLEKKVGARASVLRHSLVVSLDGKVVLDGYADFHETAQQFTFGRSEKERAFGEKFVGPLFQVSWVRERANFADDRFDRQRYGTVTLTANFSRLPTGQAAPLLAAGSQNRALLLTATPLAPDRIQLALLRSGQPTVLSIPLKIDPAADVRVLVSADSLYPTADNPLWADSPVPSAARLGSYRVELDGRTVIAGRGVAYAAPPATVVAGKNTIGSGGVAPTFTGKVVIAARTW